MTEGHCIDVLPTGGDSTTSVAVGASLGQVCMFISEYAAWLLGSGATCLRLERNVDRIAEALGCEAVMTIMPRHIHVTVCNSDRSDSYTFITAIKCTTISFNINTQLSELSWAIADGKVTFNEALTEFEKIKTTPPTNAHLVLVLASLANAAFCKLFNGDWWAVLVVFFATLAGYFVKQTLVRSHTDVRIIFMTCAFVSSVIGSTCSLFHLGTTADIAVGTSVLYLIPGIPYLNSFSDMLAGHYISAFSRFMNALILTAALSVGLSAGMMLMNLNMFH